MSFNTNDYDYSFFVHENGVTGRPEFRVEYYYNRPINGMYTTTVMYRILKISNNIDYQDTTLKKYTLKVNGKVISSDYVSLYGKYNDYLASGSFLIEYDRDGTAVLNTDFSIDLNFTFNNTTITTLTLTAIDYLRTIPTISDFSIENDININEINTITINNNNDDTLYYNVRFYKDNLLNDVFFDVDITNDIYTADGINLDNETTYDFNLCFENGTTQGVKYVNIKDLIDNDVYNTTHYFYIVVTTYLHENNNFVKIGENKKQYILNLTADNTIEINNTVVKTYYIDNNVKNYTYRPIHINNVHTLEVEFTIDFEYRNGLDSVFVTDTNLMTRIFTPSVTQNGTISTFKVDIPISNYEDDSQIVFNIIDLRGNSKAYTYTIDKCFNFIGGFRLLTSSLTPCDIHGDVVDIGEDGYSFVRYNIKAKSNTDVESLLDEVSEYYEISTSNSDIGISYYRSSITLNIYVNNVKTSDITYSNNHGYTQDGEEFTLNDWLSVISNSQNATENDIVKCIIEFVDCRGNSDVKEFFMHSTKPLLSMSENGNSLGIGTRDNNEDELSIGFKTRFKKDIIFDDEDSTSPERNIIFRNYASKHDAYSYRHNCKIYGGSKDSRVGLGIYDNTSGVGVMRYRDYGNNSTPIDLTTNVLQFGTQISMPYFLQSGKVTVEAHNNTTTSAYITYDTTFQMIPNVIISAVDTNGYNLHLIDVYANDINVNRFRYIINNRNSSSTGNITVTFTWIAVMSSPPVL